jgi:hypothetical protein
MKKCDVEKVIKAYCKVLNPFFRQLDLNPKEFTTEELIDKTLKKVNKK